jgi:hypothetical protein
MYVHNTKMLVTTPKCMVTTPKHMVTTAKCMVTTPKEFVGIFTPLVSLCGATAQLGLRLPHY